MRDLIPDIEFLKYREICTEMISALGTCCEAHFGLCKIYAREANFDTALQHIRIALNESKNDLTFHLWNAVLSVFRANSKKRAIQAKRVCNGLKKMNCEGIESLWALMQLSHSEFLKEGVEIENGHHYASKIYQIDKYFGALAWSEVFFKGVDPIKGELILIELINTYKKRPEAYLKLWSFYYDVNKDFQSALEVSEKAFLLATSNPEISVILSLNYARSLFKVGKVRTCLELLQLEYTKHSLFTVILYHYGRFCVKSKDSQFLGSAIGALEESLNTSGETRHGQIFYWLAKAYLRADEKLEAFACAKKALPAITASLDKLESDERDCEKGLCKKLNEVKDILKDLHIHLISIGMFERLLDEVPLKIDDCKMYYSSIREFDALEGLIYEAKMWWKAGNTAKAKELLMSKLQYTRVKMKVYFLLVDFLEIEKNYSEVLAISKEMVKKCRSPMVPVQIWIEANMIYAKSLIKHEKIQDALLVYKSLAQVQPIPFIPDVRYTRELQCSSTKEDLDNVIARVENKNYHYSYLTSTLVDFRLQRSKLVCSRQYFASALFGEEEKDFEIASESTGQSDSDLIGSRAPEPLPKLRISSVPIGDSANIGFSVSTNYMFLYKIGKTCAKSHIHIDEGLYALHDFLNIHHYWTREGFEIHEILKVKAKFWLGMLYYQSSQISLVTEVFRDILSMLFELGRNKMSNEVVKILNEIKE